jgi:hypothetical protein
MAHIFLDFLDSTLSKYICMYIEFFYKHCFISILTFEHAYISRIKFSFLVLRVFLCLGSTRHDLIP